METQGILVREATQEEADALLQLQRSSALAAFAHIFPPDKYPFPDEAEQRRWQEYLTTPNVAVLVARRDAGPVGVAVISSEELTRFFVVPEEWGKGVADTLYEAVLQLLRARGESLCRLWVLEDNTRARHFYDERGWRLDGRKRQAQFPPYPPAVGYTLVIE